MSPKAEPARTLGSTGISVSAIALGTSAVGNAVKVTDDQARSIIELAVSSSITVIDTGNNYGISEERVGRALTRLGGLPAGRLLATKVDPLPGNTDFSGARVRASVRESLQRLQVDHLELVHLHDPERITFDEAMAPDGPVRALLDLRDQGVIDHLGVAGGPIRMMQDYLRTGHFEALVTHNRFTLVDRSAEPLLDLAQELNVGVFNAAPYGGGFLNGGSANYCYRPANEALIRARAAMTEICTSHGVDLATAALHFSLADRRIASTIVGVSSTQQFEQTLARAAAVVPTRLWSDLAAVVPASQWWLGPDGR
jgi:D-threo-aldose 1-dehydrogenase